MPDAPTLAEVLKGLPHAPEVRVEQPRWGFIKRRDDASVDFISPLPCPYNYGCIPSRTSGDGDPLDALVLGPRLPRGSLVRVPVVAVVDFLDGGHDDPKVVCSTQRITDRDLRELWSFFTVYALFKRALAVARGRSTEVQLRGWVPSSLWQAKVPSGSPLP